LSQFRAGIKGKTATAREITDRLEGKPTQAVDLNANVSINRLERRWLERSGKKVSLDQTRGSETAAVFSADLPRSSTMNDDGNEKTPEKMPGGITGKDSCRASPATPRDAREKGC
jgi:hypothetical protein